MSDARLIIICGLPGSGKTTLVSQLENELRAIRLSADEWMDALSINLHEEEMRGKIEGLQWRVGKKLLALHQTVIVEWGTWGRWERDALRTEARVLGARVELHYLFASEDTLFRRIKARSRENPPITRDAVSKWSKAFEAPSLEECDLYDAVYLKQNLEGCL